MKEDDRRRAIQQRLARMQIKPVARLATGFESLDAALGGGLPRGAITEIFGGPGSGKTTFALQMAAHVQENGLAAAWIDVERVFDAAYAAAFGIDLERLPVAQADTAEELLEIGRRLAGSGAIDLLIVDSLAAMTPAVELQIGIGAAGPSLQARVLGSGLRPLAFTAAKTETTVLVLNQIRSGKGADAAETSAGGPSIKLYAGLRIALEPVNKGRGARFRILKSRLEASPREGELRFASSNPP